MSGFVQFGGDLFDPLHTSRGAQDVRSAFREAPCDRFADATRRAGDQRRLPAQIDSHCSTFSTKASIDGTSETLINSTEASILLIRPVRTFPGPISTNLRTPIAIIRCTDSTHRTGETTCRSSALRSAVPVPMGEASTFDTSATHKSLKCAASRIGC